jgi:hypothetical protein
MTRYTTATEEDIFDNWFDLIETDLHTRVSGFIETMIEEEFATALSRAMGGGLGLQPQDGQPHQLTPPPPTTYVPPRCQRSLADDLRQRCAMSGVRATKIRSRR